MAMAKAQPASLLATTQKELGVQVGLGEVSNFDQNAPFRGAMNLVGSTAADQNSPLRSVTLRVPFSERGQCPGESGRNLCSAWGLPILLSNGKVSVHVNLRDSLPNGRVGARVGLGGASILDSNSPQRDGTFPAGTSRLRSLAHRIFSAPRGQRARQALFWRSKNLSEYDEIFFLRNGAAAGPRAGSAI